MSLRQFSANRPILAAVLCAALQFFLAIAILKAAIAFAPPEAFPKFKLVVFASTILLPILLTHVFGLWRRVGLEFSRINLSPVFLVSLSTCAMYLSMGIRPVDHQSVLGEVLMQFLNATGEELLFRGVIFVILLTLPRWQGILLSGVLFGSMHLIHGVMEGIWQPALLQSIVTAMAGMMFAAVRYESGSLWLAILLHMLLNLSIIYSNVENAAGSTAYLVIARLVNLIEVAIAAWVILRTRSEGHETAGWS